MTISSLIGRILGLCSLFMITKWYGAEILGEFVYLQNFSSQLFFLSTFGVFSSIHISFSEKNYNWVPAQYLLFQFLLGFIAASIAIFFLDISTLNKIIGEYKLNILIVCVSIGILQFLLHLCRGNGNFFDILIAEQILPISIFISVCLSVFLNNLHLFEAWSFITMSSISLFIILRPNIKNNVTFKFDAFGIWKGFTRSLPIWLVSTSGILSSLVAQHFLVANEQSSELGIVRLFQIIINAAILIPTIMAIPLINSLALKRDFYARDSLFANSVSSLFLLGIIFISYLWALNQIWGFISFIPDKFFYYGMGLLIWGCSLVVYTLLLSMIFALGIFNRVMYFIVAINISCMLLIVEANEYLGVYSILVTDTIQSIFLLLIVSYSRLKGFVGKFVYNLSVGFVSVFIAIAGGILANMSVLSYEFQIGLLLIYGSGFFAVLFLMVNIFFRIWSVYKNVGYRFFKF